MSVIAIGSNINKMGNSFEYVKRKIVDFKLDLCCWMAPVRVGLLLIGYLNISLAVISLIGLSDDSFTPILMQVQETIMADNAKKPIPVLAYSMELAFSVVLLSALYRKDITMLRVYQKYCISAIIASIMVYSMVVAVIGIIVDLFLIVSILFQIYVVFLVRSMIVEMKLEKRNLELPTVVMSTIVQEPDEIKIENDVKLPSDSDDDSVKSESEDKKDKVETVNERPKEESSSEEDEKTKK